MKALDRFIVGAAGFTVVGLAGVAGAISYSHMAELARLHGEASWRIHAFPVSVDGIEIVASLVLLAHRRAGRPAGWLPWVSLVAGTGASVAANVAVGASDLVGRLVAGWPAIALLVSIKLLAGLLDTAPRATDPGGDHGTQAVVPDRPGPGTVDPDKVVVPTVGAVGAVPGDHGVNGGRRDPHRASDPGAMVPVPPDAGGSPDDPAARSGTVVPDPGGGDGLVVAARAVRDQLTASGTTVTRRSLAAGLRAAGYRVRNDRLGTLLDAVTGSDIPTAPPGDAGREPSPVPAGAGGGRDG